MICFWCDVDDIGRCPASPLFRLIGSVIAIHPDRDVPKTVAFLSECYGLGFCAFDTRK